MLPSSMNNLSKYLASGLMLLSLGCSSKDSNHSQTPSPTPTPSSASKTYENSNKDRILNPYSKATKQDINSARNEIEGIKVQRKLNTIARIYSGYISVKKTQDGYTLETVKDAPLNQEYFNQLAEVEKSADFDKDGHVSLEEANKLENIVINTFLGNK